MAPDKEGYRPVALTEAANEMEELEDTGRGRAAGQAAGGMSGVGYASAKDGDAADEEGGETTGFLAGASSSSSSSFHRPGEDAPRWLSRRTFRTAVVAFVTCLAVCIGFKFVADSTGLFLGMAPPPSSGECRGSAAAAAGGGGAAGMVAVSRDVSSCSCPAAAPPTTATVPQHFQTTPQLFAGPTATGRPAFLAQTVTIDPTATYVANQPLQTNIAVDGLTDTDPNIFRFMGQLSPYSPAPGFGVQEYALPPGAEIVQLQMLHRHGSRYPTKGANVEDLAVKLAKAKGNFTASGALSFLEQWEYNMGYEILVPKGRQELFDSGVLHSYMYGSLYNPNSKIIVRTTTQDRMLKSAENFLAGFFGLEWTNNATIELIIEQKGANNSLAGYLNCPNSDNSTVIEAALDVWINTYLQNATARFRTMLDGAVNWTVKDTYAAQTLCPYETAAYGFSRFCGLFTYEEWLGFEYSIDLGFALGSTFQSWTGRAVGIGYQQEVVARLQNHTLGYSGSQINVTLDNNTDTFPLNQSLYLDFSHDTNIASVLTAFGLRQFAEPLDPAAYPGPHNLTVSHMTPFAGRLDIEIIRAPHPVAADRSGYLTSGAGAANETKYIHFVLNQRTIPLGLSFPECDAARVDGWCELDTFLRVQEAMPALARYEEACFGPMDQQTYSSVTDGAPV